MNEFGFSQDMETKAKEKKLQVASPGAAAAVGNGSAAAEEAEKTLEEKKKD